MASQYTFCLSLKKPIEIYNNKILIPSKKELYLITVYADSSESAANKIFNHVITLPQYDAISVAELTNLINIIFNTRHTPTDQLIIKDVHKEIEGCIPLSFI
jgi:hypothetical protein